ncbi:sulfite exporter TauE/SafE family protein [Saccharopolyspora rhizosphaerae]|uniref:Probable membrane transporter protein n=1 Tax=Saccharopolyspora rhizosphaerae TaxID=2492662 RepID=A0A3R8P5P9_9PSEU|nr:TSUP family transporter [Saccharopolyspora rhizosphaerae]RRO20719.1 sulfite exporter TauE/SafE family protein [Saccharopolyspora rhizosphaerae]
MTAVLVLAAFCVAAAAVVGGITGFAASLLATPALLLLGFEVADVVVINLSATLGTRIAALRTLRRHVDWRAVGLLGGGGVPGAVAGAATASWVDREVLTAVAGAAVVLAGIHLLLTRNSEVRRSAGSASFLAAGTLGGYLSTTISLNGPPVAILLGATRRTPTQHVADFAGYFVAVNTMSLGTLAVAGRFDAHLLWPVLPVLLGAALVGNRVGMRLHPRVPARSFRTAVAVLVISAGLATLVA